MPAKNFSVKSSPIEGNFIESTFVRKTGYCSVLKVQTEVIANHLHVSKRSQDLYSTKCNKLMVNATCYENPEKPLIKQSKSFQSSSAVETRLSGFYKVTETFMKNDFDKYKPRAT